MNSVGIIVESIKNYKKGAKISNGMNKTNNFTIEKRIAKIEQNKFKTYILRVIFNGKLFVGN